MEATAQNWGGKFDLYRVLAHVVESEIAHSLSFKGIYRVDVTARRSEVLFLLWGLGGEEDTWREMTVTTGD